MMANQPSLHRARFGGPRAGTPPDAQAAARQLAATLLARREDFPIVGASLPIAGASKPLRLPAQREAEVARFLAVSRAYFASEAPRQDRLPGF